MKKIVASAMTLVLMSSPVLARHYRHFAHRHVSVRHAKFLGTVPNIKALVTSVAIANGVNPSIAHAIVRIESGYRCAVRNHSAAGIMQINSRTARSVGITGNLLDCRTGLEAGMRYLREAISMHGGGCAAFSAYNSGLKVHRCSGYGRHVMTMARLAGL